MKTKKQQIVNSILLSIFLAVSASQVEARKPGNDDSSAEKKPFEIGMYMGASQKVNLAIAVRGSRWVCITLKDAHNNEVFRTYRKRNLSTHLLKFNFADSQPGVYQIEVSDGSQTIVRQVEVVDVPPVESRRYIVYSPTNAAR